MGFEGGFGDDAFDEFVEICGDGGAHEGAASGPFVDHGGEFLD